MVSIIVAISENLAIGRAGEIPWHISEDLRYFKRLTTGNTVIMGRRTWESIGCRPLKNRCNIVVSRTLAAAEGALTAKSLSDALQMAHDGEFFIIGGGQLYREAMELCDRLYVTHVHTSVEDADTFFPVINPLRWTLSEISETHTDPESGLRYEFAVYVRE